MDGPSENWCGSEQGMPMTEVEKLAAFVVRTSFVDFSGEARQSLKIRILDALGCAIGALDGEPVRLIHRQVTEFGGSEMCTVIGGGPRESPKTCVHGALTL